MKFSLPFKNYYYLVLFTIIAFCALRPFCSLNYVGVTNISFLRVNEIFNLVSSYCLLVVILLGVRNIKITTLDILLFLFILYISVSIIWGSDPREVLRVLFPTFLYFITKVTILDEKTITKFINILVLSLSIPMILNAVVIAFNHGVWAKNYWTGLVRYQGLYGGPHSLAHESFVFIFFILISYILNMKDNINISKKVKFILFAFLLLAIYNIFKSYTRTVYLGLVTITAFYMFGKKQYFYLFLLIALVPIFAIKSDLLQTVFFDVIDSIEGSRDLEWMGSGRIGLWQKALSIYLHNPERYLIGRGLGNEMIGSNSFFGASHNDLISLLCSLGVTGLVLYLLIIFQIVIEIFNSPMGREIKFISIGYIVSVLVMNFLSNSYLNRFQLGQYFFFTIGLLTILARQKQPNNKYINKEIVFHNVDSY